VAREATQEKISEETPEQEEEAEEVEEVQVLEEAQEEPNSWAPNLAISQEIAWTWIAF
jgi:hypothetical protein